MKSQNSNRSQNSIDDGGFDVPEKKLNEIVRQIAEIELNIPSLISRGSDRLDFYDVSVMGLSRALKEAFRVGLHVGRNGV